MLQFRKHSVLQLSTTHKVPLSLLTLHLLVRRSLSISIHDRRYSGSVVLSGAENDSSFVLLSLMYMILPCLHYLMLAAVTW